MAGRRETRAAFANALRGLGDELLEASSGAAALELLRTTEVAVVLCDARETCRDGFDLARAIHERLRRADTAVVLVLGSARDAREQRARGAFDIIVEPIVPELLRARVRVLVELFRKARELERLAAERAALVRRHEEELQQIAHAVGHDLHEPLRTVSSFVHLLAKKHDAAPDTEARVYLRFAFEGIDLLRQRIDALRAYAGLHAVGANSELVDCGAALDRALENLRDELHESGAQVVRDPLPCLRADEAQLVLLFQNLIGNAIKFRRADARPEIHVAATPDGAEWIFSLRDNGIGIAPEFRERIFLVFRRLLSRAEYPGTGIGLALCRKIATNHGGRIWVESIPGQGSVFRVAFPMPAQRTGRAARISLA